MRTMAKTMMKKVKKIVGDGEDSKERNCEDSGKEK